MRSPRCIGMYAPLRFALVEQRLQLQSQCLVHAPWLGGVRRCLRRYLYLRVARNSGETSWAINLPRGGGRCCSGWQVVLSQYSVEH
jgi:hypothetical protein